MDTVLLITLVLLLIATLAILYLNLKSKSKDESENKEAEEIANLNAEIVKLKDSLNTTINSSLNSMSTSFNSLSTGVTKDMTEALTKVDEKVGNFNQQVELLNKSQEGITKILAGVKKYGTLAEFSLDALIKDLLPASQFMTNVKMKEDTSENVEFAIKLQGDVLVPVDSHFPVEKFKAITDAYDADDKKAVAEARTKLATAFKAKAKSVNEKYIVPPKTTDFGIVYAPTESLYKELTEYQDPSTKELLIQELMKKYKIVIMGPNTLSAYLQSLHMGFQSLKVQKGATEIYNHLKTISTRFSKHFDNVLVLRKKLEEAMGVVDTFGKDARSITRTLENIKDPEQVEIATKTENVENLLTTLNKLKINFFFSSIPIIRNSMQWNTKFSYPKSIRSMINGSRHYSIDGSRLPSVTSILSATKSEEDKASIAAWQKRVGYKEAERIKNDAANRGSSMHSFLEKYLLGQLNAELLEEDNKAKKMADEIIENGIKNKLSEVWGAEATLYYPNKYAGTADCIGIYEGKETIIDFKQSNKPKKESYIEDYFIQLGAYSLAHNLIYNSRINQGVVLICTVDNLFQDFKIEGDKLTKYQNKFLEKVDQFYQQRNTN